MKRVNVRNGIQFNPHHAGNKLGKIIFHFSYTKCVTYSENINLFKLFDNVLLIIDMLFNNLVNIQYLI